MKRKPKTLKICQLKERFEGLYDGFIFECPVCGEVGLIAHTFDKPTCIFYYEEMRKKGGLVDRTQMFCTNGCKDNEIWKAIGVDPKKTQIVWGNVDCYQELLPPVKDGPTHHRKMDPPVRFLIP